MIALTGLRSSWLTLARKRVLASLACRSRSDASSSSAYKGDDPAVGGLELVGELGVHGHHTPVGLLEFRVECHELLLAGGERVERGDEFPVLCAQLVERAADRLLRDHVAELGHLSDGERVWERSRHHQSATAGMCVLFDVWHEAPC